MEKDDYQRLFAEIVARLAATIGREHWLRTERKFRELRDPQLRITLPKLKFLEDEQT